MAKSKKYRVVDKTGVVGFKGVIHANGDVIDSAQVPPANLKAWIRFGQVAEVEDEATSEGEGSRKKTKYQPPAP
jgi:hypothetical protein